VDPYVQGIGNIEYNSTSNLFVVSGYTDFTVWKREGDGEAKMWSHFFDGSNTLSNCSAFSVMSVFLNGTTILATDSTGQISVFLQP
jgi:hypothetical protein